VTGVPAPLRRNRAGTTRGRLVAGGLLTALLLFTALAGPFLVPSDPYGIQLDRALEPPSLAHPLGRDALGRDLLARVVHGARYACGVAFGGVAAGAALGIWLGAWAGYLGGRADRIISRAVDVLMAFPDLLLALLAAALLGPGLLNVTAAVGIYSLPDFARVARSLSASLREENYVMASAALGAPSRRVLVRHILKNAAGPLIALVSLRMGRAMAAASGLSFLGLGPPPPAPEWGAMLESGRAYLWIAPRLVLAPGAALFLSALGFYLLGDGLGRSGGDSSR